MAFVLQRTLSVVIKKVKLLKVIADVLIPNFHCMSGTRLNAQLTC